LVDDYFPCNSELKSRFIFQQSVLLDASHHELRVPFLVVVIVIRNGMELCATLAT
jgi:hypothetical protein